MHLDVTALGVVGVEPIPSHYVPEVEEFEGFALGALIMHHHYGKGVVVVLEQFSLGVDFGTKTRSGLPRRSGRLHTLGGRLSSPRGRWFMEGACTEVCESIQCLGHAEKPFEGRVYDSRFELVGHLSKEN